MNKEKEDVLNYISNYEEVEFIPWTKALIDTVVDNEQYKEDISDLTEEEIPYYNLVLILNMLNAEIVKGNFNINIALNTIYTIKHLFNSPILIDEIIQNLNNPDYDEEMEVDEVDTLMTYRDNIDHTLMILSNELTESGLEATKYNLKESLNKSVLLLKAFINNN